MRNTRKERLSRGMVEPVAMSLDLDVEVATASNSDVPGLRWSLSEEARKAILEVEANIRTAEQMSGHIVVG